MILENFLDVCGNSNDIVHIYLEDRLVISDKVVGILLDEEMHKDILSMNIKSFVIDHTNYTIYIRVSANK